MIELWSEWLRGHQMPVTAALMLEWRGVNYVLGVLLLLLLAYHAFIGLLRLCGIVGDDR